MRWQFVLTLVNLFSVEAAVSWQVGCQVCFMAGGLPRILFKVKVTFLQVDGF